MKAWRTSRLDNTFSHVTKQNRHAGMTGINTSTRTHHLTKPQSRHSHSNLSIRKNMPQQTLRSLPCTFYRGGTSNGLLISSADLPSDRSKWGPILSSAMGSPDPFARQLNGMGSGVSSTSKVMVVSPPSSSSSSATGKEGVDLEYLFVQVGIKNGEIDVAGNCGNMSSAIGPFGLDAGILETLPLGKEKRKELEESREGGEVTLRLWNENTNKTIHSTFTIKREGNEQQWKYDCCGDYAIDGVPGSGSRITLAFLDPSGSKTGKALPTGNPIDTLTLPSSGRQIRASLTDVANPGVFVLASDLGLPGEISADALGSNIEIMTLLEEIRQQGAQKMGLNPSVQSIPKVVLISRPEPDAAAQGVNIVCRALSMQQAHKAVPLTLALNLGASCRIPGTLAARTAVGLSQGQIGEATVTVAHASGVLEVGSVLAADGRIGSALLHRTARPLMRGEVLYVEET